MRAQEHVPLSSLSYVQVSPQPKSLYFREGHSSDDDEATVAAFATYHRTGSLRWPAPCVVATTSSLLGTLLFVAAVLLGQVPVSERAAIRWSKTAAAMESDHSRELLSCSAITNRIHCGNPGTNQTQCVAKGCCWVPQVVPQCFRTVDDSPPQCLVRSEDKEDCGFMHITKQQCLDRVACCYAKADQSGVPWCYRKKQTSVKQVKVACVGGSITAGDLNRYTHYAYPLQLQEILGTEYFYVGNFGSDGATVMRSGVHHQKKASSWYKITDAFKRAIAFKPDIVVTQFVDNDSRDVNWKDDANSTFIRDYKAMVDSFINLPSKPKVLIMRPPPLYVDGRYGMNQRVCNKVIPDLLAQVRQARNLPPIVDVYSAFDDHCPVARNTVNKHNCSWITTDNGLQKNPGFEGVHPTDAGNKAVAVVVANAIRELQQPMMHGTTHSADVAMEPSKTTRAADALMHTSKTSPLADEAENTSMTTSAVDAAVETSTTTHAADAAMDMSMPTLSTRPLADEAENISTTTPVADAGTETSTATHMVDVAHSADTAMEMFNTASSADTLMHTSKTSTLADEVINTSMTTSAIDAAVETSTTTHAMDTFTPTPSADVATGTSTSTPAADMARKTSKMPSADVETSSTTFLAEMVDRTFTATYFAGAEMETTATTSATAAVVETFSTSSSDEALAKTRAAVVSNGTATFAKENSTMIRRFSIAMKTKQIRDAI